jgi:hypothetical protein
MQAVTEKVPWALARTVLVQVTGTAGRQGVSTEAYLQHIAVADVQLAWKAIFDRPSSLGAARTATDFAIAADFAAIVIEQPEQPPDSSHLVHQDLLVAEHRQRYLDFATWPTQREAGLPLLQRVLTVLLVQMTWVAA